MSLDNNSFPDNVFFLSDENSKSLIEKVSTALLDSKVAIIPTDTIYGFSGLFLNDHVRERIRNIKQRPLEKQFILLLPDVTSLLEIADQYIPDDILLLLPAPLTLIIKSNIDQGKNDLIAIRIPSHKWLSELLKKVNRPIISTSANISGKETPESYQEIISLFEHHVDLIIVESLQKPKSSSTILDISQKPYRVVRNGVFHLPKEILDQCDNESI